MSLIRSTLVFAAVLISLSLSAQTTPSIIADGPLTFCQGGAVTLTADAGASYLWSNGATTQSVTVTETGAYSVTTTSADGVASTSQPVIVTVNDQCASTISINNVTQKAPPRRSTSEMVFTLTLSAPCAQTVTVNYYTSNGTAIAGRDYVPASGVTIFPPGSTTQTETVTIIGTGATVPKIFWVNLTNPVNATIAKVAGYPMRGRGTITP